MSLPPWDQRLARILVRPLAATRLTPNQLTCLTFVVAGAGAGLLASGEPDLANLGAGLFVLARFLDHFDGELARLKNMTSKAGYYLDYAAGAGSYALLFGCLGIGLRDGPLGMASVLLGIAGLVVAVFAMFANIGIDRQSGGDTTGDAVGYPSFAGFELEDGIYLLAPITWLGLLYPFFIAASCGAIVYGAWTFWCWRRCAIRP